MLNWSDCLVHCAHTDAHTSNEHIISAIHFVHLAETQSKYKLVEMNRSYIVFVFEDILRVDAGKTRQCAVDEDHTDAKNSNMNHTR